MMVPNITDFRRVVNGTTNCILTAYALLSDLATIRRRASTNREHAEGHDCRNVVSFDDAIADDRDPHPTETEGDQLVVRAIAFLDVRHRELHQRP